MWQVTGAAGEPAGSALRLAAGEGLGLLLFRTCGHLDGTWTASPGGSFVGMTSGGSMACVDTSRSDGDTPAWLARARAYRVQGHERELLDADGAVVARLLPGAWVRPVSGDLAKALQQPPTMNSATVQKLRTVPQLLPVGATPATATSILGKWVPYPTRQYKNGTTPYLNFATDGRWTGSDGCNGEGGSWTVAAGGEFLATSGPSTLIGCDGAPTGGWVAQTRRAAVTDDVLTLYGADGKLIARLTR